MAARHPSVAWRWVIPLQKIFSSWPRKPASKTSPSFSPRLTSAFVTFLQILQDWRKTLDDKAKYIDSVNVSLPDHMHALASMSAMELGKHVYCQKPLTHDLHETRKLAQFAHEKGLVTQMGIQIHAHTHYRM